MASTLRLARSTNNLTKCLVQADRVSSRPLLSRDGRSYATVSDDCSRVPLIGSISISTVKAKYLNFNMPGLEKTENDESLSVFMKMPGVKEEHVKTCVVDMTTHLLSIRGEMRDESYFGGKLATEIHRGFMMLPLNVDNKTSKIKTEMLQDGMLKLTIPKLKVEKELLNKTGFFSNIIAKLRCRLRYNIIASIPSFILTFARPFVIEQLCFQMFDSFTMYKKETDQSLHIRVTPGIQKLDAISRAMCVSLNMPEIDRIEGVKSFFRHEALFIEGKSKTKTSKVHYVTGIRFPEFYDMRRRMIKAKMQDGIYKATIPIGHWT